MTEIHKENFFLSVTIAFQFPILLYDTSLFILIEYPKRNAYVRSVEKASRQNDNRFNKVVPNKLLSDFQLRAVIGQSAVCKQKARNTVLREFGNDVQNPTVVRIACRRYFITVPTGIIYKFVVGSPFFLIERRVCHNVICFKVFMLVIGEGICSHFSEICGDTTNSQVHLCKFESCVGIFLTVDRYLFLVSAMCFNEFD